MSNVALRWRSTKGKDGSLTWESVKPYDLTKALHDNDPTTRGRDYGETNRPHENTSLTHVEKEMLAGASDHITTYLQDWHNRFAEQIRTDLNQISVDSDLSRQISTITETFQSKATKAQTDFAHDHEKTIAEVGDKRRTLVRFKDDNHLSQDARYPESKVLHLAVLFLILAVEGAINAVFFSDNPYGWLGGLVPASTIAAANVGVCFIAGRWLLPQLKLNSWGVRKWGGLILLLVCVAFVIALHLAAAHLREALQQSAGVDYFVSLAFDPRTLQDTQSLVLIGLGLVTSVVAAIDGYTFDDPYPGYGIVYREWKTLDEKAHEQKREYKHAVNDAYDTAVKEIRTIPESYNATEKALKEFKGDFSTYFACVGSYYSQAQGVANALITTFRKKVEAMWESPGSFPVSDNLINSALPSLDPAGLKDEVQKQLEDYFHALQQLRDRYPQESQQTIDELGTEREKWIGAKAMDDMVAAMQTRIKEKKDQDSKSPASGDSDSRGGSSTTVDAEKDA